MRKKVIGVCFCGTGDEYQGTIMESMMKYANSLDIKLLSFFCFTNRHTGHGHDVGEYSVFKLINYNDLDAMILLSDTIKDNEVIAEIINKCGEHDIPIISFDVATTDCPYVIFDDVSAISAMTTHLMNCHDCKKINFMAGIGGTVVSDRRLKSFIDTLERNGVEYEPERVGNGMWWRDTTREVVHNWLEDGMTFDAIVCANDIMAISAVRELKEHGLRVPEDVKVTGLDNIQEAQYFYPRISTVRMKYSEGIEKCIDLIVAKWNLGNEIPHENYYGGEIIYAQSCGCGDKLGAEITEDMNNYTYAINDNYLSLNSFSKHMIRFHATVCSQADLGKSIDKMAELCYRAWSKKMWICINSDYFTDYNNEIMHCGDYAENMLLVAEKNYNEIKSERVLFPTDKLLPNLFDELNECNSIMIFPLHFNENTIGYVVREFATMVGIIQWYNFAMNIGNIFTMLKSQNQLRVVNKRLEDMYIHDSMTSLYNRYGFFKLLNERFNEKHSYRVEIISIDMDDLKYINDSFGHNMGDEALKVLSDIMKKASATGKIPARFGGDEFVVAIDSNPNCADNYINQIQKQIESYNRNSKRPYELKISVGSAGVCDDFGKIDEIIKQADEKMYKQKATHKYRLRH